MSTYRITAKVLGSLIGVTFLTPNSWAVVYEAASDFSGASNPNGVWSEGYRTTIGSTFNPFNQFAITNAGAVARWTSTAIGPDIPTYFKNIGAATIYEVPPGQVALHPGPAGQYTVLRFTAPSAGLYGVDTQFFAGDTNDADAAVLLNGNSTPPLFYSGTTNASPTYSSNVSLQLGDTLDFAVGLAATSGTTPIRVQIALVPEPTTNSLLVILFAAVMSVIRRRT